MLIKDLYIIKTQCKFFVFLVLVAILMAVAQKDISVAMPYLMFVFSIFTINTIAYDDMDGGMAFLLTLPVRRKEYVFSKYVVGMILALSSMLMSWLLAFLFGRLFSTDFEMADNMIVGIMLMGVVLSFLGLSLPSILKFGPEKGRTTMFIIFAVVVLGVYGVEEVLKKSGMNIEQFFSSYLNEVTGPVAFLLTGLVCYCISFFISKKIVENKEY